METSEFNYNLPLELIATHPITPRDAARMLVMDKVSGEYEDKKFSDLPSVLKAGDVLVFNDSKVIPARLSATLRGRHFEILLVKNLEGFVWECWIKPGRKAKIGDKFILSGNLTANLLRRENDIFILEFNLTGAEFFAEIEKIGEMPVPPYIIKARQDVSLSLSSSASQIKYNKLTGDLPLQTKDSRLRSFSLSDEVSHTSESNDGNDIREDIADYQTVFAKNEGSVAAPTAGLHFTDELLLKLREKGVQLEYVTLHVGLGTFQPISTEDVEKFEIHSEYFAITPETTQRLNDAKREGRRIIAVGTTAVRVLESASSSIRDCGFINPGNMKYALLPYSGETNIYIYPGYDFKFIDGMVTNFHLPKSSLLLLVSAFAGKINIDNLYKYAIENEYRFYSYGDGMVII